MCEAIPDRSFVYLVQLPRCAETLPASLSETSQVHPFQWHEEQIVVGAFGRFAALSVCILVSTKRSNLFCFFSTQKRARGKQTKRLEL